ncbi:PrsW family intramembrane metalloprotease [Leptodesmis sichuanensis]|uniref:PrsW family intramembrane metalloprotease n=1 Tax=Leptodesmis sichuanensis TaxID=2906798 RepID=UPI001F34B68A|nr:PrsW family intramembrane metalloprotease [Leptodesmis sichuanensis]UIE37190.1 PrsW family intramembrane metalloprotease [Leptodesmis sichuanensis A121]
MSLNAPARVLYGSPLSRPKFASFVIILLGVLLFLSTSSIVNNIIAPTSAKGGIPIFLMALAWSGFLCIIPIAILWFLDRREPESKWLYAIALLWGALIATGVAQPINALIINAVKDYFTVHPDLQAAFGGKSAGLAIAAPLAGPLVEETTKGAGVLLLFLLLRSEFDDVRDGFIYGALVGIGFNFLETAAYILKGFVDTGTAPWLAQLGSRHSAFGLGTHALFTGLFGMGLGLARQTVRPWLRYAAGPIGWLLGFSAHLVNNSIVLLLILIMKITGTNLDDDKSGVGSLDLDSLPFLTSFAFNTIRVLITLFPFFLIAIVMLWQSGDWERRVIREQLADETEPVITPEEYEGVKRDRIFRTRRIPEYDRRTSNAIVRAQDELALRKWRVQQQGLDVHTDALVASWRDELTRLRDRKAAIAT